MVFTTRLAGGSGGRNGFETELHRLGMRAEELPAEPPHHLRQGRTLPADAEEMAGRQPVQPATLIAELQALLDAFVDAYNHHRPHRVPAAPGHPRRRLLPPGPKPAPPVATTPTTASATTASTTPACVTLRHAGRLHHIGIGRTHARTHVLLLIQDLALRIIHAATGELLRELVLDPGRDYQPPKGPKENKPEP